MGRGALTITPTRSERPRTTVRRKRLSNEAKRFASKNLSPRANWFTKRRSLIHDAFAGRSAVVVCSAVVAMSACSHPSTPAKSSTTPAAGIDTLIVSVEDVRRIANADDLAPHEHADVHKPPPADANAPAPCRAVGHNDLTFGSSWSEFRSAGYHGCHGRRIPSAGFDAARVC